MSISNKQSQLVKRIALIIQYSGNRFHGWQRQPYHRTVQEDIENTIAKSLGYKVSIHGAGRTDAGVHATAQVAHFDYVGPIPPKRLAKVINRYLPEDILIRNSEEVSTNWHARFSAQWRRYRYTLYTNKNSNLFVKSFSWHYYRYPLKIKLMVDALTSLLGTHHLTAFRKEGSQRTHSWVEIQDIECYRKGAFVHVEIQANGFLYGMVRLLIGMLVEVGIGKLSLANFNQIWRNQGRKHVRHSAPANGLCLLGVGYPEVSFSSNLYLDTQPLFETNQIICED
ncbi:tRNA pseudouridine synthase A [cyanobacterium endosymbiont of Braarudosphaera bigelowii]|uniref:tRNA pseudouridine synthase A n=1 Tax=cyanobacterium endosymbiont of Braarudosphaera bigelowii TaxID=1285375 RepID=A0ABM7U3I3_9CHRO|nr:tRNA pseudouridine synthase A [cyanobacterium endosymbiont of Braarudosphaera bigelowii]